jgi:hypothetical protein
VIAEGKLGPLVARIVDETPILDIHTHLYPPEFGPLLLWGIDEVLTYHYLVAEVFRVAPLPYERFWAMSKREQADHIWKHLFVERSPLSEACRGVLTVLHKLGLDTGPRELPAIRRFFAEQRVEAYVEKVFELANLRSAIMTNDPFDPAERPAWEKGGRLGPRFQAALRIDPLLNDWPTAAKRLAEWGYRVDGELGRSDVDAVQRFLRDWIERMRPRYMAVSLPPTFALPERSSRATIIEQCILPLAREAGIPFALMIGVHRQVNPGLRVGGDSVRRSNLDCLDHLCRQFPDNRFLVTTLAREDQHELCVTARKHPNLLVFGCWWFLNNPSIIEEMTRERFELLGLSVVPQHSDARVLDQIIYKWSHWRGILTKVLTDKYRDLAATGWPVSESDIRRDVTDLNSGIFERFCGRSATIA